MSSKVPYPRFPTMQSFGRLPLVLKKFFNINFNSKAHWELLKIIVTSLLKEEGNLIYEVENILRTKISICSLHKTSWSYKQAFKEQAASVNFKKWKKFTTFFLMLIFNLLSNHTMLTFRVCFLSHDLHSSVILQLLINVCLQTTFHNTSDTAKIFIASSFSYSFSSSSAIRFFFFRSFCIISFSAPA